MPMPDVLRWNNPPSLPATHDAPGRTPGLRTIHSEPPPCKRGSRKTNLPVLRRKFPTTAVISLISVIDSIGEIQQRSWASCGARCSGDTLGSLFHPKRPTLKTPSKATGMERHSKLQMEREDTSKGEYDMLLASQWSIVTTWKHSVSGGFVDNQTVLQLLWTWQNSPRL
ncbi:hypothetical protein F5141DRAFT_1128425 [Pisolithus sp. B1]|nr:hypothetical protein F5141DRAFT_1128425 [Pisolithus sp. B1]